LNPEILHSTFSAKRILITGSTGYLASNLIGMLKDVDCHIVRLDLPGVFSPPTESISEIEDLTGDVRKQSTWESTLEGIDLVFHFAAQTSAYVSNNDPQADHESNVLPMLHLLETCRQNSYRPKILFSSTVTIAGLTENLPVNEMHPDNPITIYDLHKLMAEMYLKQYISQNLVDGAILRLANVYGPGPKSSRSDRGILNMMIRRALAGEPLTVYEPGDYLRDYVFVKDVVCAFIEAARNIKATNGKHFIIGCGQGYTITQAINIVADKVSLKIGRPVEVKLIDPPTPQLQIEARNFVADTKRFYETTGWQPCYMLSEGIERTIETFL